MFKHQSSHVRSLNYDNQREQKILLITILPYFTWVKVFIRNIQCWSCGCSQKVLLVAEERFDAFKTQHWFEWGGGGGMEGGGDRYAHYAILWKCLNTFVLHCGLMNLQAYKSCYASQRETVAKYYVWITSVSNSFHCSSVSQPLSQSACVKHKYSNNNQTITPLCISQFHLRPAPPPFLG